jgi:hypothetical protein
VAERANLPFGVVAEAARLLQESGLLVEDRGYIRPAVQAEGLPTHEMRGEGNDLPA